MKMTRNLLTGAVLLAAFAAAGCDTAQFNSFNEQFKTVKKTTGVLKNSSAPAAAMATSLTAVELMNALSNDSAKRAGAAGIIATGGGNIIATGGGNIIATGGGNYVVQQAGGVKTEYGLKSDGTGFLKSTKADKVDPIIELTFNYKFEESALKSSYSLSNLEGKTNGFDISGAGGTYAYELSEDKKKQTVSATITGKLVIKNSSGDKSKDKVFTLEKLSFFHTLPGDNVKKELGSLEIDDNGNHLSAKVNIQGQTVTASGSLKDNAGNTLYTIEMDESGVKTSESAN